MNSTLARLVTLCAVAVTSASAEIIGVEQFDYPDGAIAGKNAGTFWDYQNRNTPAPGPRHTGTFSDWNAVSGAPAVKAGHLVTNSTSAKREYNGPGEGPGGNIETDEGYGAINNFSNGTISFQYHVVYHRVTFTTGATLPSTLEVTSSDLGTDRVVFGVPTANDPHFGIRDNPSGLTTLSSTVTLQANTTYTLVTKLDYIAGTASLYLNPDPDLNATESSQTPVVTRVFTTDNWSTAVIFGSGSGGSDVAWNNVVAATTWDDLGTVVTTAVDEDNGSIDPGARPASVEPNALPGTGVSLREALKYSPSGTLITFAPPLSGKTIMLTKGELIPAAGRTLTVDASGLPLGLTIDGNNASRLFFMNNAQRIMLRALNLTGGNGVGGVNIGLGGAIHNTNTVLRLLGCTLSNNRGNFGGAIYTSVDTSGFSTTLDHCTLAGNSATQLGGAIYNDNGPASLTACTVSGNSAPPGGGGGVGSYGDSFTQTVLNHTIVSANTGGGDVQLVTQTGVNSFNSQGYNLVGTGNGTGKFNQTGDQVGVTNPKLSPLGYFGGPTMTMHPLINSPAIDGGSSTNPGGVDQRGFSRFVDGDNNGTAQTDIGAVEAGPISIVTTAVDEDDGGSGGSGVSLREAINEATVPGQRVVFSQAEFPQTIHLTLGELDISSRPGLFLDASNISGGVQLDANNNRRAVNIESDATVAMHHFAIINGKLPSAFFGGGGAIMNSGSLSLFFCSVANSRSGDGDIEQTQGGDGAPGGGIFSSGRLSLTSCNVTGNQAGAGGRAFGSGGIGGKGGSGGGIYNSGILDLIACNITGNSSGAGGTVTSNGTGGNGGDGGGIFSSGMLRSNSSSITGNQSSAGGTGGAASSGGNGGGIDAGGLFSLVSCTIANNQTGTGGSGGGIFLGANTNGTLSHLTIAGNKAPSATGGGFSNGSPGNSGGMLTVHYSIVSQNTSSNGNVFGPFTNDTNLIGGDPLLAPLNDYGGPTLSMALKPGSPARDAATDSTITADQRGFAIVGVPDIGAYEAGTITNFNNFIWETLPADATDQQHDATADYDGDGQSNYNEYIAGTDVTDRASVFRTTNATRSGSNFSFTFTSVVGRNYVVQFSTDLIRWTDTVFTFTGAGSPITTPPFDVSDFTKLFFRARIAPSMQ
jgi:hypothetical protein